MNSKALQASPFYLIPKKWNNNYQRKMPIGTYLSDLVVKSYVLLWFYDTTFYLKLILPLLYHY